MTRPSWDAYFMTLAVSASSRATCDRAHVGCILVRDNRVLATGYNGSVRGASHCDDVGHDMVDGHCVRTVHAEQNAVAQAARNGVSVDKATAYVTHSPCGTCFRLLANAGIIRIVCGRVYRDTSIIQAAQEAGIALVF